MCTILPTRYVGYDHMLPQRCFVLAIHPTAQQHAQLTLEAATMPVGRPIMTSLAKLGPARLTQQLALWQCRQVWLILMQYIRSTRLLSTTA